MSPIAIRCKWIRVVPTLLVIVLTDMSTMELYKTLRSFTNIIKLQPARKDATKTLTRVLLLLRVLRVAWAWSSSLLILVVVRPFRCGRFGILGILANHYSGTTAVVQTKTLKLFRMATRQAR